MSDLTNRAARALAAPMAALLPAEVRALLLDLVREIAALRAEVDSIKRGAKGPT